MCLVIPADLASRRTIRVAAWRFSRSPERASRSGPGRSAAARSRARAIRGGNGMTASLAPFRGR